MLPKIDTPPCDLSKLTWSELIEEGFRRAKLNPDDNTFATEWDRRIDAMSDAAERGDFALINEFDRAVLVHWYPNAS